MKATGTAAYPLVPTETNPTETGVHSHMMLLSLSLWLLRILGSLEVY